MPEEISNELLEALYHGQEETYLEYKGDVPWTDRAKKFEIIRTIFAMANQRDGGVIIVGVENNGNRKGLSDNNYNTFSHDEINSWLNNKSNQKIQCKVEKRKHVDREESVEKNFVFIQVSETKEFPVVYTANQVLINETADSFPRNIALRCGGLYIRNKSQVGNKDIESVEE